MRKKLIVIKINVEDRQNQVTEIVAVVDKIEDRQGAEVFQFFVTKNEKTIYDETYVSSSLDLIKLKVVDELRNIIGAFDPEETLIIIIEDSHQLLNKAEIRCPNCQRKLFESWGRAKGMVVKCKRCSTLVVPGV